MNSCRFCRDHLNEFLEGTLSPSDHAQVAAHLETCADCAREKRELEALRSTLRGFVPIAAPAKLRGRVRAALQEEVAAKRARSPWLAWKPGKMVWAGGMTFAAILLMVLARPYSETIPVTTSVPAASNDSPRTGDETSGFGGSRKSEPPLKLLSPEAVAKAHQNSVSRSSAHQKPDSVKTTTTRRSSAPQKEAPKPSETDSWKSTIASKPADSTIAAGLNGGLARNVKKQESSDAESAVTSKVRKNLPFQAAEPALHQSAPPVFSMAPRVLRKAGPAPLEMAAPPSAAMSGGAFKANRADGIAPRADSAFATESAPRFSVAIEAIASPKVLSDFAADVPNVGAMQTAPGGRPEARSMSPASVSPAPATSDATAGMPAKSVAPNSFSRFRGASPDNQVGALESRTAPQTPALAVPVAPPSPIRANDGASPLPKARKFRLNISSLRDLSSADIRLELPPSLRFSAQDAAHSQIVWHGDFEAAKRVEVVVSLFGVKGGEKISVFLEQKEGDRRSKPLDTQVIALPTPPAS